MPTFFCGCFRWVIAFKKGSLFKEVNTAIQIIFFFFFSSWKVLCEVENLFVHVYVPMWYWYLPWRVELQRRKTWTPGETWLALCCPCSVEPLSHTELHAIHKIQVTVQPLEFLLLTVSMLSFSSKCESVNLIINKIIIIKLLENYNFAFWSKIIN